MGGPCDLTEAIAGIKTRGSQLLMLLDAVQQEQAAAEAEAEAAATKTARGDDGGGGGRKQETESKKPLVQSHAAVARDFIAHLVNFVEAITGQQGDTSMASLVFPSLALPSSGHADHQQQQQKVRGTPSTSFHSVLFPLLPILVSSFQAAIQASSSSLSLARNTTNRSADAISSSNNTNSSNSSSISFRPASPRPGSSSSAGEETVPSAILTKKKKYTQPPSGINLLLARTDIPPSCPIAPLTIPPLGEGEGAGGIGLEGRSEAVERVRKVLSFLVERGLTGVDSAVEVAHAILHAERYYEKYHRVRLSVLPSSIIIHTHFLSHLHSFTYPHFLSLSPLLSLTYGTHPRPPPLITSQGHQRPGLEGGLAAARFRHREEEC